MQSTVVCSYLAIVVIDILNNLAARTRTHSVKNMYRCIHTHTSYVVVTTRHSASETAKEPPAHRTSAHLLSPSDDTT